MRALRAVARPQSDERDVYADPDSLEQLVLACLESLADIALEQGQRQRASRLLDAAGFLRLEHEHGHSDELTDREWEVATLVARGQSNRRIAGALVVSERTVDTHVGHILRKLSLTSRAQIAAWVVQQQRPVRLVPQIVTRAEGADTLAD